MTEDQRNTREAMISAAATKADLAGKFPTIRDAVIYGMRFADNNPRPDMVAVEDVQRALGWALYKAGLADTSTSDNVFSVFNEEVAKSQDKKQLKLF
jgi:hypothetical protein